MARKTKAQKEEEKAARLKEAQESLTVVPDGTDEAEGEEEEDHDGEDPEAAPLRTVQSQNWDRTEAAEALVDAVASLKGHWNPVKSFLVDGGFSDTEIQQLQSRYDKARA